MTVSERRAHARVAVPLRAVISAGEEHLKVALRDISRSGAFAYVDPAPAEAGKTVQLAIEHPEGKQSVEVTAEIVRVVAAPDAEGGGILGVGVRFLNMDAAVAAALEELILAALHGPGGIRRASPRVAARLRVRCCTDETMDALVRDISRGGVAVTVDRPVSVGDTVEVEISSPGASPLALSGRVAWVDEPRKGELARSVGIEFDALAPSARGELNELLDRLVKA